MNVTKLRELLGQYGEIGRVFLQPASNRNTWSLLLNIDGAFLIALVIDFCTVFSEPEKKTRQTLHRGLDRIRTEKGRQNGRRTTQWQANRFPEE